MRLGLRLLRLVFAAAATTAAAEEGFKGGLWRTFKYDEPTDEPIVFSGESRCEKAFSSEYCIWLDLWYDDGTPVWQRRADWTPGTHDWEKTVGAFVPERPVKKIEMHAFLRNGEGKAEFRNLKLERREGKDDVLGAVQWMTERPYANRDRLVVDVFTGRKIERRMSERELPAPLPGIWECALPKGETVVWTADSMRRVTPLTFPDTAERTAAPEASVSLAKRERESFQIEISCGEEAEWRDGGVVLPVLRNARGEALKGALEWRRVGYVRREPGYYPHPCGVPPHEMWLPDPLLPPAPFRVRPASTQGLWITVHAAPDAVPGVYSGDLTLTEGGEPRATVRVTAKVEDFSLPETFGMKTSFSVMDGFTRAQYPDRFEEKKRESWDILLDHRLNPDDISRTSPPEIGDLLYARSRGMNLFNILNIVPPPKDPSVKWVCWVPPETTEDPAFYPAFKARLAPYVAELRKHGLEKLAYLYGFDERESEYYPGIDELWRKLKADFPDIPVMTTAMMYRDYAAGKTNLPCLLTTDWHCPLTDVYRPDVSDEMRRRGKKVWWYVCCGPRYPYANFASLEYPPVEGRLLGWMTHLYRADGLLYWHVNYWNGPCVDEGDTFLPDWKTASSLRMPGDGVLLYPGREHVLPSIRLAQVRDAVEDYEWLQLAAAKAGADAADAASRSLVRSMTNFTRDPAAVRAARDRLAETIAGNGENDMNESESQNLPASSPATAPSAPAFGAKPRVVVVNEDNDHYFKQDSSLMTVEALEAYVDKMAGGKVTHFFMCPSGQRPSYGSKAWEPIWTGLGEPDGLNQGVYTTWAKNAKLLFDRGIDPYAVWIRRCRERGISPWLSPRMNDCHDANRKNPFRSTFFWREHDELHCEPGYRGGDGNRATFNFAHDAVQDYTFALVKEQLDRYDIDGYELDFMRFHDYFPRAVAAGSSHHLDRFVKRVRDYVDAKAAERGHPILLGVRVAPTPAGARSKGCDVGKWVREGWVDWVCASTYWETPDYNTPVAEWREWFGDRADEVVLLAGTDHGVASTLWNQGGIRLDMEMKYYAGFADVQWGNGVDGLYLFNIPYLPAELEKVCRQGLFPEDLDGQLRAYPVSYRWEAWGGSPDDLQLSRKSDRPNEFAVRLGTRPTGRVSVVLGVLEKGAFNPDVTLNGVAATGSCEELMQIRPTGIVGKQMDYHCRRYFFPDGAVHGGAGNVVRVGPTDEAKTIVWCEIDLEP